jgi:hypothetical protein
MMHFCGLEVRTTEAIYQRHLLVEGKVLWVGARGVMENVLMHVAKGDSNITLRLLELMDQSVKQRRSIQWSP